jgi:adenylate cyclase
MDEGAKSRRTYRVAEAGTFAFASGLALFRRIRVAKRRRRSGWVINEHKIGAAMSQARTLAQTQVGGRWPRPQFAQRFWHNFLFFAGLLLLSAAAGMVYTRAFGGGHIGASIVHGLIIGGLVIAFERGLILRSLHRRIRNLPTLLYIACAEGAYAAVIVAGMALGGGVALALGLTKESYLDVLLLTPDELLYALAVSALVVFVIHVRDLLGAEVFGNLLIGRYRRPVREQRIFLFLDVLGSTAFAEIHGDLRAQEYLAGIFAALAEPVRRTRGSIYDYFGDMAMISWPFARGVKDARCVACVFEILREIEIHRDSWRERFGQVPQFRAALHGGPVVTAEVGVDRHKISYFGDVLNATGRMEALCRTLEAPILISADLLSALPRLPEAVTTRPLGEHAVKGRGQPLSVFEIKVHQTT